MKHHLKLLMLAIAAAMIGGPAMAQIESAQPLPVGQPLTLAAGERNAVRYFYFAGVPGETRSIDVSLAGKVIIEVYDAAGTLLMVRSASAGRSFDFIPSYAETYVIAVIRPGAPIEAVLRTSVVAPTFQQSILAIGVGYEFATAHGISRSCWSEQGAEVTHTGTLRKGDAFTMRIRLGADRLSQTNETLVGAIASRSTVRSWLEGANRVSEVDTNGSVSVSKQVNDPASFRWPPGVARKWYRYTCPS